VFAKERLEGLVGALGKGLTGLSAELKNSARLMFE
jgi:hypothetical protein